MRLRILDAKEYLKHNPRKFHLTVNRLICSVYRVHVDCDPLSASLSNLLTNVGENKHFILETTKDIVCPNRTFAGIYLLW